MVQQVQQWLSTIYHPADVWFTGCMSLMPVRVRASFFHVLYLGCHQEMWPRVNLHTLKDLDQRWALPSPKDLD